MVSPVLQRAGSGFIWEPHLEDHPLPCHKPNEELIFEALFKDTINIPRMCSSKKDAVWKETAQLKDVDYI